MKITKKFTLIPEAFRPPFQQRFNKIRTAFLEEEFADLLGRAQVLQDCCRRAAETVTDLLLLDGISLSSATFGTLILTVHNLNLLTAEGMYYWGAGINNSPL